MYLLSGNKHPTREINACLDDLIEAMKSAIGNPDSQKSAVATWEKESYSVQVGKGKFKNYTGTDSASVGIVFKYKGSDDEQGTTAQNGNKDYKLVKAYAWNSYGSYYEGLVIENRSGETKVFDAQVMFYDAQNSLIGVGNYSTDVVGNGKRAIIICSNEEPFHHLEYTITPNETRYSEVQSFVNVQQKIKGGKVIIMATNNGDVAAEYVKYNCLFINKNKKVVDTDWGYITDDDSELKPGKTEYREESCSEPFQTVEIYYTGRY